MTDIGLPGGIDSRSMADAARMSRPDLKALLITGCAENAIRNDGLLTPGMTTLPEPFCDEGHGQSTIRPWFLALSPRFAAEARASLPGLAVSDSLAPEELLTAVALQRIRLRHDQGVPEWDGASR